MNDTIIKIENLYKEYRLGVIGSGTLYWDLQSWWARIRGKEDPNKNINLLGLGNNEILASAGKTNKDDNKHFYALNDINLEVKEGEILGIIGRNGAGKTTLLKIISRITAPTKGTVKIKGRVGSLLEVGTGFHPELTGKENIYLNGAILGMRKREINKKLDEIIAFAEIDKFIDTPVKRYSSGMYVRLAFAVAAHLEPEILIVDEVLAVGDADFQKKCLGKMQDISKNQGRTVLFVSHNIGFINEICNHGVMLNSGKIIINGDIKDVVNHYLRHLNNEENLNHYISQTDKDLQIDEINIFNHEKAPKNSFSFDEKIYINYTLRNLKKTTNSVIGVGVYDQWNRRVFTSIHPLDKTLKDRISIDMIIPEKILNPGKYYLDVAIFIHNIEIFDRVINKCSFEILDTGSNLSIYYNSEYGVVNINCEWLDN